MKLLTHRWYMLCECNVDYQKKFDVWVLLKPSSPEELNARRASERARRRLHAMAIKLGMDPTGAELPLRRPKQGGFPPVPNWLMR